MNIFKLYYRAYILNYPYFTAYTTKAGTWRNVTYNVARHGVDTFCGFISLTGEPNEINKLEKQDV